VDAQESVGLARCGRSALKPQPAALRMVVYAFLAQFPGPHP